MCSVVLVLARHGDDGAGSDRGKTRKTDQLKVPE